MSADIILHHGKVATNGVSAFAEAVATTGNKILAAGTDDSIMRLRGPTTRVVDLQRRTVIPDLNDSHLHVIRGGLNYNMELRWDDVPNLADALRASGAPSPSKRPSNVFAGDGSAPLRRAGLRPASFVAWVLRLRSDAAKFRGTISQSPLPCRLAHWWGWA